MFGGATVAADGDREAWLRRLAAGAATIDERMAGGFRPADGAASGAQSSVAQSLLERWCEKVAEGDEDRFAARLGASGWDRESVADVVGEVAWPAGVELPAWTTAVQEAATLAASYRGNEVADAGAPLPFEALAHPFLDLAQRRWQRMLAGAGQPVPGGVAAGMTRHLLDRLTWLGGPSYLGGFATFRRAEMGPIGEHLELASTAPGNDLYIEYQHRVLGEGYFSAFAAYPSLARMLGQAVIDWSDGLYELVVRRQLSTAELSAAFGLDPEVPIERLEPTRGDNHAGRAVIRVVFADGTDLAYKPRSTATDVIWSELCQELNRHVDGPELTAATALDCERFGWARWIEHAPCASGEAVEAAYRTAGLTLALGLLLGSRDLHYENVVVDGTSLVVVDTELVLQPDDQRARAALYGSARTSPPDTVLTTLLLPSYVDVGDGEPRDVSALGRIDGHPHVIEQWQRIGTNAIGLVEEAATPPDPVAHLVRRDGETQLPEAHSREIVEGFEVGYGAWPALAAKLAELGADREVPIRVLMRPTWSYDRMQQRLRHPDALRSGVHLQTQAEVLARTVAFDLGGADYWPIVAAEIDALAAGDTPIFWCDDRSTEAVLSDSTRLRLGDTSALDAVDRRLTAHPHDVVRQKQLIAASLALRTWRADAVATVAALAPTRVSDGDVEAAAGAAALRIGERLAADAWSVDDGLVWIGARPSGRAERQQFALGPTGFSLYDGNVGIAVFLAALARITGADRWRRLALDALDPVERVVSERGPGVVRGLGFGAHSGAAGAAYGLVVAGTLVEHEPSIEAARTLVEGLALLDPAADTSYDVIGGAAGTILAASPLRERLQVPDLQPALDRLAAALVETATPAGDTVGWPGDEGPLLHGYAHGAVGIAAALAAVVGPTGDEALRRSCVDLIERVTAGLADTYVTADRAWLDPAAGGVNRSWCRGSVGELFALDAIAEAVGLDDRLRAQADNVRAACGEEFRGGPALCCGTGGRLELWRANPRERDVAEEHRRRFVTLVAEGVAANDGRTPGLNSRPDTGVPAPGLYVGDAGIGYVLASLVDPTLPVLAAWETGPVVPARNSTA